MYSVSSERKRSSPASLNKAGSIGAGAVAGPCAVMTPETITQALRHLSEADPVMARVIAQAGPPTRLLEVAAHPVPTNP